MARTEHVTKNRTVDHQVKLQKPSRDVNGTKHDLNCLKKSQDTRARWDVLSSGRGYEMFTQRCVICRSKFF